jgi:hypothetical protein
MLHHACLLSAVPVHSSPLAPRKSDQNRSSALEKDGRSWVAAAVSSALQAATRAARNISSAKSGREQRAKGFVIGGGARSGREAAYCVLCPSSR